MRVLRWLVLLLFVSSCTKHVDVPLPPISVPDAGVLPDLSSDWAPPTTAVVIVDDAAPEAVRIAAEDVRYYLGAMGLTVEESERVAPCSTNPVLVVEFVGESVEGPAVAEPNDQTFGVSEERCDSQTRVALYGGGLLGRQYAAYAWLHELGVRFFHPEEEFIPPAPLWRDEPLNIEQTPAFRFRSVSLHLTHPLELGDVFRNKVEPYAQQGRRYIDWQLKNFASSGASGVPFEGLEDYGHMRGFPRSVGFDLHQQQQGGRGIIDPDSPLSDDEQIALAIDERMGTDPANYPERFLFTFNPSEFTELPDDVIVHELTFIADYMAQKYPDTIVMTINHGTAGPPTANYGVRFYDLPQFAPPNLGVMVHTLMFYDLERPAPVYGNDDFHFLYDFMEQEYQKRRIWYFPEGAWWLTFDIPVPLYLPITIEARDRDLQKIRHMLDGKLDGHHVFGTGHEWGYWQNEYCSLRMSADLDYRWTDCLDDITAPLGDAAEPFRDGIEDLVHIQESYMFDRELLRWVVGTDAETELAAQIGVVFHPLPPAPADIMRWTGEEITAWESEVAPRLQAIVDAHAPVVQSLNSTLPFVPDAAASFAREIADGAEVNMLRPKHALEVYGAVIALRKQRLGMTDGADPAELLAAAQATTADAARITRRRAADYRYIPNTRAIAGGPDGTDDQNWTGYPYRYLNRAHHVYFYRRIDQLAQEAIDGVGDPFSVVNVVLAPGEDLMVAMLDDAITDVTMDFGDAETTMERLVSHPYSVPGVYDVGITGSLEGNAWTSNFEVAQTTTRYATGRTGTLVEPMTDLASQIEGVLPALVLGPLGDGRFVIATSPVDEPEVPVGAFSIADEVVVTGGFQTAPSDLRVPLSVGGSASAALTILSAVVTRADDDANIYLSGDLITADIIDAIVGLSGGAFDPVAARNVVAEAFGYTSDTLPEDVPFSVEYAVQSVVP